MGILDQFKKAEQNNMPSVIKNPFSKDSITEIHLHFYTRYKPHWSGSVVFKNGLTSGRQELRETDDFENIIAQIREIGDSLK